MRRPRVYLAGPITGLNYKGAVEWRDYAKNALFESFIDGISPMRGKQYLRALDTITDARAQQGDLTKDPYGFEKVMSSPAGIVGRDRNDVLTSDAVLMNLLGSERISIGTMIEVGWADAFRKPIVVVQERTGLHRHGMVDALATYTVDDLDEALDLVRLLVSP